MMDRTKSAANHTAAMVDRQAVTVASGQKAGSQLLTLRHMPGKCKR
jgi:hypothetical protein